MSGKGLVCAFATTSALLFPTAALARPTLTGDDAPRAEKVVQSYLDNWKTESNAEAAAWNATPSQDDSAQEPLITVARGEGCDLETRFRFTCDYVMRWDDGDEYEGTLDVVVRRNGKLIVKE